jgi:hypothetical protein
MGFGLVGIIFSVILIQVTISKYHDDQNKYPAAVAAYTVQKIQYPAALAKYHTLQKQYTAALAKYNAAVAKHVQPAPVPPKAPAAPKEPVAPHVPTLDISSFSLPILYIALSLAYFFLGYRVNRQRQQAGSAK